ncbi:protein-disulfide reductase DsbD domain-containing protein, partial [Rhodoferax sp.]|uniref:protein-disulfide reductase DsbD domain-containing protein n=1 Tax=Rhodoferax sp. TaxID=50421 RepID=UPI0026093942
MAHAPDGATPGKTVWVGLQLQHQPQWHTYWKNSGDSGQPTTLSWTLPTGVLAGDVAWPLPKKIPIGNLANYGYDDTVLLPVPLTITPDFKPSPITPELVIRLQASWLVCKQECVPQDGDFTLSLPVKGSTALNNADFQAAFQAQPQALSGQSQITLENNRLKLTVANLPAALQGKTLEFFPEIPEVIETAAPWTQAWQGAVWTASVPIATHRGASPASLPLVLVADAAGRRQGFSSTATVSGTWPAQAAPGAAAPAPAALPAPP